MFHSEEDGTDLLRHYQESRERLLVWLREKYIGREVTLIDTVPRISRGRAALITNIALEDEPLFLCMVSRAGTDPADRNFLNSEGWTRSYRPARDFLVLPK